MRITVNSTDKLGHEPEKTEKDWGSTYKELLDMTPPNNDTEKQQLGFKHKRWETSIGISPKSNRV